MSKQKLLTEITVEQEDLIPVYCKKWLLSQNLTEVVNYSEVIELVQLLYKVNNYLEPEILFYSSPFQAIESVKQDKNLQSRLGQSIQNKISRRTLHHLQDIIKQQMSREIFVRIRNQTLFSLVPYDVEHLKNIPNYFPYTILECLRSQLVIDLEKKDSRQDSISLDQLINCLIRPSEWANWGCTIDFCISVLQLSYDVQKWQILRNLICQTGFLIPCEKVCILCERPSKISFDEKNFLHAEGQPALLFRDDYRVYAHHGKHPS
ncbi:MAG: hypothetical protein SFY66_00010 [Oculatellaceae cyanobacterium bins.114]|nr:hypothetical protein [Oculatellaceae cyanobacterium bins.114]